MVYFLFKIQGSVPQGTFSNGYLGKGKQMQKSIS